MYFKGDNLEKNNKIHIKAYRWNYGDLIFNLYYVFYGNKEFVHVILHT